MGAKTAITEEQYLRTSFPDLDKEYRDGEIVERSLPDNLHSKTQGLLVGFFVVLRKTLPVHARPELRVRVRQGRYLVPDVAVFHPIEPTDLVPSTPPLIAIEILSPDDRMNEILEKLEEYRTWGVQHVWLVDPHRRRLYVFEAGLREVPSLSIPELGLELAPAEVFG